MEAINSGSGREMGEWDKSKMNQLVEKEEEAVKLGNETATLFLARIQVSLSRGKLTLAPASARKGGLCYRVVPGSRASWIHPR